MKKILVAYDGSDPSKHAFKFACDLAEKFKAKLLLLSIVAIPEPTTSLEIEALLDQAREHYRQEFEDVLDQTMPRGIDIDTRVEVGHPAEHIVAMAEKEHVDLIVMGRRGRSQGLRWMLGSISEKVLRYAHCPVTVVK